MMRHTPFLCLAHSAPEQWKTAAYYMFQHSKTGCGWNGHRRMELENILPGLYPQTAQYSAGLIRHNIELWGLDMINYVISSPISSPDFPLTLKVSEVVENPGKFLDVDNDGEFYFSSRCDAHVYRQGDRLYYQNSLAPILGRYALRVWEARLADLRRRYAHFPKQFRDFYWELEKRVAYHSLEEIAADIFGEGFDPLSEENQWRFFYCAKVLERLRYAEDMVELLGGEETCRFEDYTVNRDAFFAEELRKIASFLDD